MADYVVTTKDINLGNVNVVRSVKDVVTITKLWYMNLLMIY